MSTQAPSKGFWRAAIASAALFLLAAAALQAAQEPPAAGELRVTFFDVGQGDGALVRTPGGKVYLIDAGDDRIDSAQEVIVPYLRKNGIARLDAIVMSHPHRDHIGGIPFILENIPVQMVVEAKRPPGIGVSDPVPPTENPDDSNDGSDLYRRILELLRQRNIPLVQATRGQRLDWDAALAVEVVHDGMDPTLSNPPGDGIGGTVNINNLSLVLRLSLGEISYLFTGDAEQEAEASMIHSTQDLTATVLKVAHHGSDTSSTPAFLDRVTPAYAIVSVGRNSFRHPLQPIVQELRRRTRQVFLTSPDPSSAQWPVPEASGTIESHTDGKTIQFSARTTPLAMVGAPRVAFLAPRAAVLAWTTSKPTTGEVRLAADGKRAGPVRDLTVATAHMAVLAGLHPATRYRFTIAAASDEEPPQTVTAAGELTTPDAASPEMAGLVLESLISSPDPLLANSPAHLGATVRNQGPTASPRTIVSFFQDGIESSRRLGAVDVGPLAPAASSEVTLDWVPRWAGATHLLAVLSVGPNVLAVSDLSLTALTKTVVLDASHRNRGAWTNEFADFRMALAGTGFSLRHASAGLTGQALAGAWVLIVTNPSTIDPVPFSAAELLAVSRFVAAGGGLLAIGMSDFKSMGNPAALNSLLTAAGSRIRFNSDQVVDEAHNAGNPWNPLLTHLAASIVSPEVKVLQTRNGASLINDRRKPIGPADRTILPLAWGGEKTRNMDADGLNDAVIYDPARLPVVCDAAEKVGKGRVAAFGSTHIQGFAYDPLPGGPDHQTSLYNLELLRWLAAGAPGTGGLPSAAEMVSRHSRVRQAALEATSGDGAARLRYVRLLDELEAATRRLDEAFLADLSSPAGAGSPSIHELERFLAEARAMDRVRRSELAPTLRHLAKRLRRLSLEPGAPARMRDVAGNIAALLMDIRAPR